MTTSVCPEINAWNAGCSSVASSEACDPSNGEQRFIASTNQTLFVLTAFEYAPGTNSLSVHRNGLLVDPINVIEVSATSFWIQGEALAAGDIIVAHALTGIIAEREVLITALQSHEVTLNDAQQVVSFPITVPVSESALYIRSSDVDSSRLIKDIDYTVDITNNIINLIDSYPAGTILLLVYNDAGAASTSLTVLPNNTIWYQSSSEIGTNKHLLLVAGASVKTNYYDSANTSGSGADLKYTGVVTIGKAGNSPDVDGYFYDLDGKQFEVMGLANVKMFGAVGDGVTDDAVALQTAINFSAATLRRLYVPGGLYLHSAILYFYYDLTNNPNYPSGVNEDGRFILFGDGCPNKADFVADLTRGSIFKFTGGAGNGVKLADSTNNETRNLIVRDIGFYADTTGYAVQLHYAPQKTSLSNVFMGNKGDGGVFDIQDVWSSEFRNLWCYGNTLGTAINYNPTDAGGGNLLWDNVNTENCDIGMDFGAAFDPTRINFMKNQTFINCQSRGNTSRNLRIRCGFASGTFINFWSEDISGAVSGIEISNMAGWDDDLSDLGVKEKPGLIRFIGGQNSWSGIGADFAGIQFGDSTGTDSIDSIGNVIIDGMTFGQIGADADAMRRHNALYNSSLKLKNLILHDNGGQILVIDDEAQHGPIYQEDWDANGISPSSWVEDAAGADKSYWLARSNQITPQLPDNTTIDYSNAIYIPDCQVRPVVGDVTITLPSSPAEQTRHINFATNDNNNLILDPGVENINGATTDLTIFEKYCTVILTYDTNRGWTASVAYDPSRPRTNKVVTTAELSAIADPINTDGSKNDGVMVWDTTANIPMYATGLADASTWVGEKAGSTITITPA
jgi:hypothetical protein